MPQFVTWTFEGDFASQRNQMEPVAAFMKSQGFSVAWECVRVDVRFVVFVRETA